MQKILTIIIPTYNMESLLASNLDSLIVTSEAMSLFEALVIIDGSKDKSSEIAHKYQDKYSKTFRVIDKENGNYGSCINRGLKEAKGKYVKIMDADDSYDTVLFEQYLYFLHHNDADLVINDMAFVTERGREFRWRAYNLPIKEQFGYEKFTSGITKNICMHSVAYKTEKIRAIQYFQTEGISYTDMEWMFLPMTTVETISYFPHVVYRYLIGREGQTVDVAVHIRSLAQEITGLKVMLQEYKDHKSSRKEVKDYLLARLKFRAYRVYEPYFSFSSKVDINKLIEVDDYIKENYNDFYVMLNSLTLSEFLPFKFIAWWRKDRLRIVFPFYIKLAVTISKILEGIKNRTTKTTR